MLFDLDTPSGKTSPASFRPPTMFSDVSSLPLSVLMRPLKLKKGGPVRAWSADLRDEPRGAYWMLNGSAWPNGASACSLSSVLETGPIPEKYYLSARACSGILRRADKRGKQLPKALREALEAVANGRQTLAPPSMPHGLTDPPEAKRRSGTVKKEGDSSPMSDSHSTRKVGGVG